MQGLHTNIRKFINRFSNETNADKVSDFSTIGETFQLVIADSAMPNDLDSSISNLLDPTIR